MVDVGSFLHHHHHPRPHSPDSNHPAASPSALPRDVGSKNAHQLPQKRGRRHIRPSPFQRDVGGASSLNGGTGEVERPGGTQLVGGPGGKLRKRATTFVVARFLPSLHPQPITDAFTPIQHRPPARRRASNHDGEA
jgi:hypothetical protein